MSAERPDNDSEEKSQYHTKEPSSDLALSCDVQLCLTVLFLLLFLFHFLVKKTPRVYKETFRALLGNVSPQCCSQEKIISSLDASSHKTEAWNMLIQIPHLNDLSPAAILYISAPRRDDFFLFLFGCLTYDLVPSSRSRCFLTSVVDYFFSLWQQKPWRVSSKAASCCNHLNTVSADSRRQRLLMA